VVSLKRRILQVAKSNATLLIVGETGTGKEVVANEVFRKSARSDRNFVKINCAALPQELIESELFGYEEGSFTGARRGGKRGLFEQGGGGSILLDEVNSLNLSAQAKILRVLQEKEVQRIGGEKSIPVDVRIIATSNKALEQMVVEGTFREDLYYRLNVLHIDVPPLRERREDIPLFVRHCIRRCNREMDKHVDTVNKQVYEYLMNCPWPGNVRQLQNHIERAMTTVWKNALTMSNFFWVENSAPMQKNGADLTISVQGRPLSEILKHLERGLIQKALERNDGNRSRAALELGIARQILYRKMKLLDIS
jgi:transcriptional regulator with PAS, ATPase and Fis domain